MYRADHEVSRCSFGLCGVRRGNRQVTKMSLCASQFFLSESKTVLLNFTSTLSKAWEVKLLWVLLRPCSGSL